MQETLNNLETYGYIILLFYSFGGGLVGIVSAGVLSAFGEMNLLLSIGIASFGNIIGSTSLVYLGRYQKQELQKYLQKHKRKVALTQLWLRKFGIALIFANKYIYGFKTILPLVVGLSKYSFSKFFLWNTIASMIWGISLGLLGFFASNLAMRLFDSLKAYSYALPLGFVILLILLWLILKIKSKK